MLRTLAFAAALVASGACLAQGQGVSKTEITVGTIMDLSGPVAAFGKESRNGILMRFEEANAQGGINGRKVKVVVEDNGYDPKRAVLAAQKLVNSDKVFAVIGHIGTAMNMAAMPIQNEKQVINFLPLTGAREMFDPPTKLKIAFSPPYYDQVRTALDRMVKEKGYKRVGIIYQDDEFGLEVLRGTEDQLKVLGMTLAEKTSYKRGSTDFSSQVQRLRAANCDLVVMGTIIRETVGTLNEARKIGYAPAFVGTTALYTHLIHQLGGKAMDGLYGANLVSHPYPDDASKNVRDWVAAYKARFNNEDPGVFSVYGYYMADLFVQAATRAGANLNVDTFNAAMQGHTYPRDRFGSPEFKITATDRLGWHQIRISQIIDGKWTPVTPLLDSHAVTAAAK